MKKIIQFFREILEFFRNSDEFSQTVYEDGAEFRYREKCGEFEGVKKLKG